MSFIEFIGFIFAMVAMIFLFIRKVMENRRRRLHPEEFAHEQEEQDRAVKELLESLNIHIEEPKKPKQPPAKVKKLKEQPMQIAALPLPVKSFYSAEPKYHSIQKEVPSRASRLIRQVASPQEFIIYHEILGPPKGLKKHVDT